METKRRRAEGGPAQRLGPLDVIGLVLLALFVAASFARLFTDGAGRIARQTQDRLRADRSRPGMIEGAEVLFPRPANAAAPARATGR